VGGIWVAPLEIEDCLLRHPDVFQCAVVPHAVDGLLVPCAYVVLKPPAHPGPEQAVRLQEFVRSQLSPHKYPRLIRFVDDLPRTASGKIDRKALRSDVCYEPPVA